MEIQVHEALRPPPPSRHEQKRISLHHIALKMPAVQNKEYWKLKLHIKANPSE
jgi:hypothetical protein